MISHHRSIFRLDASGLDLADHVTAVLAQEEALAQVAITVRGVQADIEPDSTRLVVSTTFDSAGRPDMRPSMHREYVEAVLTPIVSRVAPATCLDPRTLRPVR